MKKIFIGMIFIFLDFELKFGTASIDLIPDFIGYILMFNGLDELLTESPRFSKARSLAIGMSIYSAVVFVLDMFSGYGEIMGYAAILLGAIATAVSLFISYNIICGLADIERTRNADLKSKQLKTAWTVFAVAQVCSYFGLLLPAAAIVFIITSFICCVIFLCMFYKAWKAYENLPERTDSPSDGIPEINEP